MDQPTLDETKQPSPQPSTETITTLTTTSDMYLSTHLIVPYFINAQGEIKRPEHLIAWWSRIFSFLICVPDDKDRIELRFLCRLFRDALKPPPLYTIFPHPNYSTLNNLMDTLNIVYRKNPNKVPKIVFVMKGTFDIEDRVTIRWPMKLIGAGQDKTIFSGQTFQGFFIGGREKEGERVVLKDATISGSIKNGLVGENGLFILCDRLTFTQCRRAGFYAYKTQGRLINCVITQCGESGILCQGNALIELEGDQTKVDGNGIRGWGYFGLNACSLSSIIHLLYPLTKESVSTNNGSGQNHGGKGTIETVAAFAPQQTEHC